MVRYGNGETEMISVVIYGEVLEKCIGTIGGD